MMAKMAKHGYSSSLSDLSSDRGPMVFGYARVSTKSQASDGNSLEAQEKGLRSHGAERIVKDAYTGKVIDRPGLDDLLAHLKPGDTLIVTKLDRIARSLQHGISLIEELQAKDVAVNVLNLGMINNTPNGNLVRNVFLAFAEFEREMILQRTREGREVARTKDGYREGRPRKYSPEQIELAMSLLNSGESYNSVSRKTGISKSTLIRAKKEEP